MSDTNNTFCSIIFDILEQKGVRDVICSPGSRNIPLLLAAASRKNLNKHFVVDERSAAFMALGIATVSQRPVVINCTSGTAMLNYSPAIAEAYYQGIPIIVLTADRPIQWIDQDDSQTIRQDFALSNFVKQSYSVPSYGFEEKELQWYVNRITNDALISAQEGKPGPVHINIHIGEPLNELTSNKIPSQRIIDTIKGDSVANKNYIKELAHKLSKSKIMFVAGFMQPDSKLQKSVSDFVKLPNVAVMAETISNLHLDTLAYSVDSTITAYPLNLLDSFSPDIVISLGGSLVSRKLKEYLRRNKEKCEHWSLGFSHTTADPFLSLSLKIECNPAIFLKNITSVLRKFPISGHYKTEWNNLKQKAVALKSKFVKDISWSELKAFDIILKHLPSDFNLFLSNGTSIRYAQIINYELPHASYCNRGVSGIDGSVSTAVGGSTAYKGRTLLITGDLSLAYDIGALTLHEIPNRFKIIVIDNQGGGIFRFIPSSASLPEREEYLCQSPILPLKQLSEGYSWEYFEADNEKDLLKVLPQFLNNNHKSILKIHCQGELSAKLLTDYMKLK